MKPLCIYPWYQIMLTPSGGFGPCCQFAFNKEGYYPASRDELFNLFNSNEMIEVRQRLKSHDIAGMHCEHCLKTKNVLDTDVIPAFDKYFEQIVVKVEKSFEEGLLELSYHPLDITLSLSKSCNLKCTICCQSELADTSSIKYPVYNIGKFIALVTDIGWSNIARLCVAGGEIFAIQEGKDLIDFISGSCPKNTSINIVTNGTLLHEKLIEINSIKNLELYISIDGFGAIYESIRRGAKWTKLVDNLIELNNIRLNHNNWIFGIQCICMNSTLPHLSKFIELMHNTIESKLFVLRIDGDFYLENIFMYPSLLEGTRWVEHFDDSILVASNLYYDSVACQLREFKSYISAQFLSPSKETIENEWIRVCELLVGKYSIVKLGGRSKDISVDDVYIAETINRFINLYYYDVPYFVHSIVYIIRYNIILLPLLSQIIIPNKYSILLNNTILAVEKIALNYNHYNKNCIDRIEKAISKFNIIKNNADNIGEYQKDIDVIAIKLMLCLCSYIEDGVSELDVIKSILYVASEA